MAAATQPAADICWGTSKKTNRRCANKSKVAEPGCLPTCHQHRDQLLRPGTCQHLTSPKTGARCKHIFHWEPGPPYFELCPEHVDAPQGPCHFLRLPVELRMEIFKYILPSGSMVSSNPYGTSLLQRLKHFFPLLLVSKQIGSEARDHLYASTTFHIELGHLGATIRNRYLYRPRSAEDRYDLDPVRDRSKGWDIRQQLDFSRVRNYNLEITVQNSCALDGWSEEVEMYDLRDSISAILPYLSRAQQLHHLTVRVVFCRFDRWSPAKALANFKLITFPLTTALRGITRPTLEPIWKGEPLYCHPASKIRDTGASPNASTAPLPTPWTSAITGTLVPPASQPDFLAYKTLFESLVSGASPVAPKPPIARMFSAFKRVYLECAAHIAVPSGAANFLHRARVARESDDLDAFYDARNGFVKQWNAHLEAQYYELARVNGLVVGMFECDAWDPRFAQLASPPAEGATSLAASSAAGGAVGGGGGALGFGGWGAD